ncbi:hypothetical protein CAPTEDRAFT_224346 [Capitella teleta]|uniref:Uncharacterized protein n=1 Tax=Capitella teleta TaxID=283909 RepID=R7TP67_CAPTE|nr:hypothetical protein CAPTEDRAFT_224346 [Capitella teleta]|eukprot:ELT95459.1 hypothetical protein CAPTEDRAFT_224346 [Capitella teleta]
MIPDLCKLPDQRSSADVQLTTVSESFISPSNMQSLRHVATRTMALSSRRTFASMKEPINVGDKSMGTIPNDEGYKALTRLQEKWAKNWAIQAHVKKSGDKTINTVANTVSVLTFVLLVIPVYLRCWGLWKKE